jgi:hypothetical protein
MQRTLTTLALAIAGCGILATAASAEAQKLTSYRIDANGISVSGISSGGFMAVQFHVAHSQEVMGAGVVAAGPYNCANSKKGWPPMLAAVLICSHLSEQMPFLGPPSANKPIADTKAAAQARKIDATTNLKDDKVWLFSGAKDTLVPQSVVTALETYYKAFVKPANVEFVKNVGAAHAMVTSEYGNACDFFGPPYINDCDYDAAGKLLQHIYGGLNAPKAASEQNLLRFDQQPFFNTGDSGASMAAAGHVYVPGPCARGETCRLHVAFHGCEQSEDQEPTGDAKVFYKNGGYNEWAESNNIIVLYPQAAASGENPKECWNWWGYGNDSNFYLKNGKQILAVQKMIDRISGR